MRNGIINFDRPEDCLHRQIKEMDMKPFGEEYDNFVSVDVTGGECGVLDEDAL